MWADSINHRSEDPWSNVSLREYSHSLTAREDAVELPARRAQSYHTMCPLDYNTSVIGRINCPCNFGSMVYPQWTNYK